MDFAADPDVLDVLLARREAGSAYGDRADGHRVAVVVGGGGMRGAYTGGMAYALQRAGLIGGIDLAYGSSAGAFVACSTLTGRTWAAARIFPDDMADKGFIDFGRLRQGKPIVSLDYLLDEIMVQRKPMPWDRLEGFNGRLNVVLTAADDLHPHVLHDLSAADWKRAFRATACIPFLAGGPVELLGRRWIDGSVAEPLPLLRALRDGATHVLVLLNRTADDVLARDESGKAGPKLWMRGLDRLRSGLGAIAHDGHRNADNVAVLTDPSHPDRAKAAIHAFAPAVGAGIGGLSTDKPKVNLAVELGMAAVDAAVREAEARQS